jgi:hypothetical protein
MTDPVQEGSIVYRFNSPDHPGNILYVNMSKRYACTNDCLFCGRPRLDKIPGSKGSGRWRPNIYEKKAGTSLYLSKVPSPLTALAAIDKEIEEGDE